MTLIPPPAASIQDTVDRALAEDVGPGDLTRPAIPAGRMARATIVAREAGVVCGQPYAEAVFEQLGGGVAVEWRCAEGAPVAADTVLAELTGPAGLLVTGERTALNLLQTLSGTASATADLVARVADLGVRVVDTRKTLPGLRTAQKYAVRVGGGHNHRHGLYDGALLKENHIAWAGGIAAAVAAVRDAAPHTSRVQVEVEDLGQLDEALAAGADAALLDNFAPADLEAAVVRAGGRCFLEASGNIHADTIRTVAATGVDAVSVGALTRDLTSLDLSMRFQPD
jgi:nicotinate-nucleotide pyrophosphorylase (carboxylating)